MFEHEIEYIRTSLELFTKELTKEYYLFTSGLKSNLNLNKIYSDYSFLFSSKTLETIQSNLISKKTDGEDKRKLKYLLEGLYAEVFADRVKCMREKLSVLESSGTIELAGGEKIKYINSLNHLYNNDSRNKREIIRSARCSFIEENINPILIEEFETEQAFIKSLGYSNKIQMFHEFTDIDLYKLNEQMKELLDKTEAVYKELMKEIVTKKIGVKMNELHRHDVYSMMRGQKFDDMFPADKMIKTASALCSGMGIDIYAMGRIIFDTQPRDTKSPRAFCATVSVPDEIYLVMNPQGGVNDYSAFLHEMGHALHFAHVPNELDFEYKNFGDYSVSEGFAMLFDHLLSDKEWLISFNAIDGKKIPEYIEFSVFKELFMLRRYAAKLEYEIMLNESNEIAGNREIYTDIFKRITYINYDKEEFLTDVDPYFYCARYLRAWMLQVVLKNYLCENFGNEWFKNEISGKFLKEIWAYGQKYSADELLRNKNCGTLSVSSLLDNIETMLNKS